MGFWLWFNYISPEKHIPVKHAQLLLFQAIWLPSELLGTRGMSSVSETARKGIA